MFINIAAGKKINISHIVVIVLIVLNIFTFNLFKTSEYTIALSDNKDDSSIEKEFENNVNDILSDIETGELDEYLTNEFDLEFLSENNFKDMLSKILKGVYFDEYDLLFDGIVSAIKDNFKQLLKLFLIFLFLVLLYEVFKNISSDKFSEINTVIKLIFSLIIILLIMQVFADISKDIVLIVEKMFKFSKVLFPLLLSLILLSGSTGTYSVYSSLSLFLINGGSYLFIYFLLPLSISIFLISIFGSILSNKQFGKVIDIFKTLFKYSIIIYFSIFGLFSSVNIVAAATKDGVGLRLTKYAIKNYVPIVGGYVSQGFDFVHSCSIIVKNSVGIIGIIVLFFNIIKPVIFYFCYLIFFKLLSAAVGIIGNGYYSDIFDSASKTMSYFLAVLVGLFFVIFVFIYMLIVSVSVV